MAEECPVCNYLGKTLNKLSAEYQSDVKFVAVFPQRMSNYKTASLFRKKYDLEFFEIEIDHNQSITKKYNAMVTPEVVLVDGSDTILYQGRLNNSYAAPGRMRHGKVTEDLEKAIIMVVDGKSVSKPWPDPIGCYITRI
jgi:thiol-disulfide isomerase/thioredoxin